jgi:2-polyprenyl-3-methyl-5-hydroxy-6-metoxy-1,4-benzoquinol methylase
MKTETHAAIDPFAVDKLRQDLATSNLKYRLLESYQPGAYPNLPDMSSRQLWDTMIGYKEIPIFRTRRLRKAANYLPEVCKVLDIGSGWREIVPMVLEKPGREYVGLDFSEAMAKQVAEKYPHCQFMHGDISQIKNQFDVVLALEVCEHIVADKIFDFYREVQRLLPPGGLFIVTVPLFEDLRAMTLCCPKCGQLHNRMGHVRSYSLELIQAELNLAGFEVVKTSLIYALFDSNFMGGLKRNLANLGRRLFGLHPVRPLNAVVVATKLK